MVRHCCIKNCGNEWTPNTTLSFHSFPKNEEKFKRWVNIIPIELRRTISKYSYICSEHFSPNDYIHNPLMFNRLKNDAVPTIFNGIAIAVPSQDVHMKENNISQNQQDQSTNKYIGYDSNCSYGERHDIQEEPPTKICISEIRHEIKENDGNIKNVFHEVYTQNQPCVSKISSKSSSAEYSQNDKSHSETEVLKRKIYSLKRKLKRKDDKINSMAQLIEHLKVNKQYDACLEESLSNSSTGFNGELLLNEMKNMHKQPEGRRYTDRIKQFASTLYFYSPKAYEFLRKSLYLPHPNMLRKWFTNYDCETGFLSEVFEHLRNEVKGKKYIADCALMIDAMSIRTQIIYDKKNDVNVGYVDYGNLPIENTKSLATEVLVLLIVSYTTKFKCPIGYFYIDKISGNTQALIVHQAIVQLSQIGIPVHSVTCDGTRSNLKTLESLGANLNCSNLKKDIRHPQEYYTNQDKFIDTQNPELCNENISEPGSSKTRTIYKSENIDQELRTAFKHPENNFYVYSILDACHMIKLCRNAFAESIIISPSGKIDFIYVKRLHELQEAEDLKLANKISNSHINFKNKKMNVRLAAQTISSGTADAIEFLRLSGNPNFIGSEATCEFLRIFDRLFDIMNVRSSFGKGFKSPMRLENLSYIREVFESSLDYISQLKIDEISIFNHPRFTFALGFVVNIHSLLNLAKDLLTKADDSLKYFLSYKCSQDHLELFFSCLRSRGGWNDNPNCLQFKWALRQLLFNTSVTASVNANCLGDTTEIPSILKFRTPRPNNIDNPTEPVVNEDYINNLCALIDNVDLSFLKENILFYIAGHIVKNLFEMITCEFCLNSLTKSDVLMHDRANTSTINRNYASFTTHVNRGKLAFASPGVYRVVLTAEKAFQAQMNTQSMNIAHFKKNIVMATVQSLYTSISSLFPQHPVTDSTFSEDLHEIQLIKYIASTYTSIRIHTYNKKFTDRALGKNSTKRQQLHKMILFYHV